MSEYYKADDIFQVIDKIIQNATEEDAETIMGTDLVIEINKLPTIEVREDCISREGVYRAIITCGEVDNDLNHLYKVIENEPSVVPTTEQSSKVGEWIDTGSGQECSVCGEIQYGYDSMRKFCANCGADMKGKRNGYTSLYEL